MANVIAKCRCGKVTTLVDWKSAGEDAVRLFQVYGAVQCECGRQPMGFIVESRPGKRECGAWCTEGTGRRCTCVCGGRNHGSRYSHTGALWQSK